MIDTIPEGFAATGCLLGILAAFVFLGVATADQYGNKPELFRLGSRVALALVALAVPCALAAIWTAVLL